MALPRQVEAQLKELEAIEKQLNGAQEQTTEPASAEPTPQPQPAPAAPQPEVTPKPAASEVPEETWQQKYRTLKGMYDAEVPRLHAQVKELNQRMEQLQRAAEAPKTEPQPRTQEKLVTDADVQAFGEDLIEVQRKVAREVAQEFRADLEAMKAENAQLRAQLQTTSAQVVESSFEQKLNQLVPDFATVNADPKWIAWLNEIDLMIRAPRKTVAQDAFARGDAEGVAYYVDLFKQTQVAAEPTKRKSSELELQVQPKRNAPAAAASQAGRTYSTADIDRMFQQVRQLGAAGKLEDARKLEAEIDSAYMEGRVAP
jgi:hypothetical protein